MTSATKKKILIVEDEAVLLELLTQKFENEGFTVIKAKDGKEGLENSLTNHPDIILLDILMPRMNGIEMLKHLRKDKWGEHVPVFLLTNLSPTEPKIDELKDHLLEYFIKTDWKLSDLTRKVKEKLKI